MLSPASLNTKLEALKKQTEELVANINAVYGAISFCEQLLKELAEPAPDADKE